MAVILLMLLPLAGFAWQAPPKPAGADPQSTLLVRCQDHEKAQHVVSPTSLSEDQTWRAYVEVDVRSDLGCLYTTRLWVVKGAEHKLIYLIPPKREAVANGMEILGWARGSRMLLVKTEEWQIGSDAPDTERVLAIDAATGMVYDPNLEQMLEGKRCMFRVTDAGFRRGRNVDILVRAQISTFLDVGETEEEVSVDKRCTKKEETWSFDFSNGEMKQIPNSEPLQLYKKFLSDRDNP